MSRLRMAAYTGCLLLAVVTVHAQVPPGAPVAAPDATSNEQPIAFRNSRAQAVDRRYIRWREHIIDDASRGVSDLSGSDGLALADLDLDGFEDVVSVHESDTVYDGKPVGHVRIAWGSGDAGTWTLSTLASGHEAAAAEDVAIGDLNGDGFADVVVACELAHLIYFENPGKQARSTPWQRHILPLTQGRGSYIRVAMADFNGDDRLELVAVNKGAQNPQIDARETSTIAVLAPAAGLIGPDSWREQVLGHYRIPINARPLDLDGDGDLDIVAGSRGERRIFWLENDGRGAFTERAIVLDNPPKNLAVTGFNLAFADLNGDGRVDIVSTAWPGSLLLLQQPEGPTSAWSWSVIGAAPPDQLASIALADIDGDGDLDAFSGAYSRGPRDRDDPGRAVGAPSGRIAWFENPGSGRVSTPWQRHDISRRQRGMYDQWVARDLDSDGDMDFIGTRGNSEPFDGVIWLEQVRSERPGARFRDARQADSPQLPLPPGVDQATSRPDG